MSRMASGKYAFQFLEPDWDVSYFSRIYTTNILPGGSSVIVLMQHWALGGWWCYSCQGRPQAMPSLVPRRCSGSPALASSGCRSLNVVWKVSERSLGVVSEYLDTGEGI